MTVNSEHKLKVLLKSAVSLSFLVFIFNACTHSPSPVVKIVPATEPVAALEVAPIDAPVVASTFLECQYFSTISEDLETISHCAESQGDSLTFLPEFLKLLKDRNKATCVYVKRNANIFPYYVLANGRHIQTIMVDNGCDCFEEDLARAVVGGKIAFVDAVLDVKIKTDFEWAKPFDQGRAVVCRNVMWVQEGESKKMSHGQCAEIDKKGKVIGSFKSIHK